jgi:hypothetical protein
MKLTPAQGEATLINDENYTMIAEYSRYTLKCNNKMYAKAKRLNTKRCLSSPREPQLLARSETYIHPGSMTVV